ncbi:MAG: phospho-N-acetylmuramoyl-pentapeptide-transferase [Candidatus Paceibacteria bacterium]|jgi:phospho-N-acetylmuramoyl-pentapeptide-transferase
MFSELLKVIIPGFLTFLIGMGLTPFVASFLYKHKMWKRSSRSIDSSNQPEDEINPDFKAIHNEADELNTPRIGGVLIWGSVLLTIFVFWIVSRFMPLPEREIFDFISRGQTWLPLFTLVVGSLLGLADDLLQILGKGKLFLEGLDRKVRIFAVSLVGLVGAWWFFSKLGITAISIPFSSGTLELGWLFVPFFIIVVLATFSSSVIDGIDGLAGGVMMIIYSAFALIAFSKGLHDIAALCSAISGGLLAFLWFNIPPARFYMGDTGMLGLTITLAIISFLTDSVLILPIIAFPLVLTSLSSVIQITSKRLFNKKVFKVAPLHHHFEAIGWSRERITMRYWVLTGVFAMLGVIIELL